MINNVSLNNAAVASTTTTSSVVKAETSAEVKAKSQVNTGASAVVDLQSNVDK